MKNGQKEIFLESNKKKKFKILMDNRNILKLKK
jgi:hypothetical protein